MQSDSSLRRDDARRCCFVQVIFRKRLLLIAQKAEGRHSIINKRSTVIVASTFGAVAAFAASGAWAADGENFSLATGFDYSTGKYGSTNTTNILSIPLVGTYQSGPWVFKLSVPYVRISGVGGVLPGGKRLKAAAAVTTTAVTTQSGLGDIVAAATCNVYSGSENNLVADLIGKIKFGTADTGLGTGRNDYAAQVDVFKNFDSFTAMGSLGYEVQGSPAGVDMNNVAYGILGGNYQFTDQTGSGAEMKLSQMPSTAGAEQRELSVYASYWVDDSFKIRGYVLKGFTDGSPDSGFGVLVTSSF